MSPESGSGPQRPDRSLAYAIAVSLVLIILAGLAGLGASRLAGPAPTPAPSVVRSAPASPSPTDSPDTGPLVFTQPLSAGCVAGGAVYVVSDGGGIGRFAFDRWQLIDATARSLVAAACRGDLLEAVGGAGRVVTIDDRAMTVRSDGVQLEDLLGVAPLGEGVIAVGRRGTAIRQVATGWSAYAQGIDEDLSGIVAFGEASAWAVGAGGASYRLEPAGWRPVPTGVTSDLRAVAAQAVDDVIASGDDGVVLDWAGRWTPIADGVPHVSYRAALRSGDVTYVAGDSGTLLRLAGARGSRVATIIPLGGTCTLRALFGRSGEVWVVGSDGGRAAVWRVTADGTMRWGDCP